MIKVFNNMKVLHFATHSSFKPSINLMVVDNFIMYPKCSRYYNIALCNTCIEGPPLENGNLFFPIIISCLKFHPR